MRHACGCLFLCLAFLAAPTLRSAPPTTVEAIGDPQVSLSVAAKLETLWVEAGPAPAAVALQNTYAAPVVVCSVAYDNNTRPVVTRISNVTGSGFDVRLQNPGDGATVQTDDVYCLVAEKGNHVIDGVRVEASTYLSTVTDRKNSWTGTVQVLEGPFTNPVILGQVMSSNDSRWSVFWDKGSSRTVPPTAIALTTGKTVAEDSDTNRLDETIGYIAIETAHGTIGGVEFETRVGPRSVSGLPNGAPHLYNFDTAFPAAPEVGIVSMAGVVGGDGGWAQLHPTSPFATASQLQLSIDEDQIGDSERSHGTERVAYAVFADHVLYPPGAPEACAVDVDCDDGQFCNGAEICGALGCESGTPPCSGGCDEIGDACVTSGPLRLETVILPSVGGVFQSVATENTYVNPVIVCNAEYQSNTTPVVVRLDNVAAAGFDIKLQNPSGGAVSPEEVFCLIVEEGTWVEDGVRFEAQRYTSTVTDSKISWIGAAQAYGQSYTDPVVVGQVMTHNDPAFSVYWQQGSSRTLPPGATLINGKTVLEDTDRTRVDEMIGFIVFEAGHGSFLNSTYEAAIGADTVQGPQNGPPFTYNFIQPFATAPDFAVTSMAGVDGGDGAWSQLHPASPPTTPTTLNLSVDEDQIGDTERSHTTEQVNYIVFEDAVMFPEPPVSGCTVDADCPGNADFCDGPNTCIDGTCFDGPAPCGPGETCDEGADTCEVGTDKLETVVISSVGNFSMPTPVALTNTYTSPVVVCTVQYVANSVPVVVRVSGVTGAGFDVGLQNPGDGIHVPDTVHCLIVEEGAWMIDGNRVEARKYTSTVTDTDPGWLGAAQALIHPFTQPIIVGQVMTVNDPLWSVYWQRGVSRGAPPTASALRNGKTVMEDPTTARSNEVVGYIAFEEGVGTIDGVLFEAFLTNDFVEGVDDAPPYTHALTAPFTSDPQVGVLSSAGIDGIDGFWPYWFGANALRQTEVDLVADEDQLENLERGHTTEQIMGVVFEESVSFASPTVCTPSDSAGSPNCDGVCSEIDEALSPDCDDACDGGDVAGSVDCDGICTASDAGGSTDCDGNCDASDTPASADCDGDCDSGDSPASGDCDGVCDPADPFNSPDCDEICETGETGSEDCDGYCDYGETLAVPDCNGVCDRGDEGFSADCNYICELTDADDSADCDGECDGDDVVGSADCDGVCDLDDDRNGPDCNGTCDISDEQGSPDCDGICEVGDNASGADCDGFCDFFDTAGSPDCDGSCEGNDSPTGPDCCPDKSDRTDKGGC